MTSFPLKTPSILKKPAAQRLAQELAQEEKQVIIHCRYACNNPYGMNIRIWPTTYLVAKDVAHKSELVHAENIPFAPARALINANAAVAIATDYNPGSTPSGKVPFLLSLACIKLRMTPAEAINAVTINGAHAMELQNQCGVIAEGRPARLIITKPMKSLAYIPYAFGSDHIEKVVLLDEVRNINTEN